MKQAFSSLLFFTLCSISFSQNADQKVIASAGNYFENSEYSISWTLGEPVTATISNDSITLTQGFQQSFWKLVEDVTETNFAATVKVWPNPATSYVNISVKNDNDQNSFKWKLIDVTGKTVMAGNGEHAYAKVNLNGLTNSIYFINIQDEKGFTKSYKVIKN